MPVLSGGKKKTIIHVADEMIELPQERPLPLDQRIQLDARIRAECVEIVATDELKSNPKNAKKHPERQIALLAQSFEEFGFTTPILVDEKNQILAGHARYLAAKRAGLCHVPVIRLSHLRPAQKRALAISDNKLAELGEWDFEILAEELKFLNDPETDLSFDPRIIGFDTQELDGLLIGVREDDRDDPADDIDHPDPETKAVTARGDLWICDQQELICGDATEQEPYTQLMKGEKGPNGVHRPSI